jgi:hypothetical protein
VISAVEWTVRAVWSAADSLIVKTAYRLRWKQLGHRSGVNAAIWIPRLIQLYHHEGFRFIITDTADKTAPRYIRASERWNIERARPVLYANGSLWGGSDLLAKLRFKLRFALNLSLRPIEPPFVESLSCKYLLQRVALWNHLPPLSTHSDSEVVAAKIM